MENLSLLKYGYLLCSKCHSEICEIKERYPILTNKKIGEHRIETSWMDDSLKFVYNKNKKIEKSMNLENNEINLFVEKLKKLNIKYENLLSCNSGKHIVGYVRDNEKYIYYGSDLTVKYPDMTYEPIINEETFINDFMDIKKKIDEINEEKKRPEFKNKIFCKLCGFNVKYDLSEFKAHLREKDHEERLKELRREFI